MTVLVGACCDASLIGMVHYKREKRCGELDPIAQAPATRRVQLF